MDTSTGDLVVATAGGTELRHAQPKIYQEVSGKKVRVKGGFQILKGDTAGFTLEEYDPKQPLVIDPTISFVRFLGGSNTDEANAVAVDGLGYTYVTGQTYSGNFNVYGGIETGKSGNSDAFVTKLGPEGNIVFSSYLGGGDDDLGTGSLSMPVASTSVVRPIPMIFRPNSRINIRRRVILMFSSPNCHRWVTGLVTPLTSGAAMGRTVER